VPHAIENLDVTRIKVHPESKKIIFSNTGKSILVAKIYAIHISEGS
jgi:hypothetical protein